MRRTVRPPRSRTRKPPAEPRRNMLERAAALAHLVNSTQICDPNELTAESQLDIPQLKKTIAECRRAIALQIRILDELEELVKDMQQNARKKTPAASKKRK